MSLISSGGVAHQNLITREYVPTGIDLLSTFKNKKSFGMHINYANTNIAYSNYFYIGISSLLSGAIVMTRMKYGNTNAGKLLIGPGDSSTLAGFIQITKPPINKIVKIGGDGTSIAVFGNLDDASNIYLTSDNIISAYDLQETYADKFYQINFSPGLTLNDTINYLIFEFRYTAAVNDNVDLSLEWDEYTP